MHVKSSVGRGLVVVALLGGCQTPRSAREAPAPAARATAAPLSTEVPRPQRSATEDRLVDSGLILEAFASRFGAKDLQQIPSEVIEEGDFRYVPYLSYSSAQFELNIYGDAQHPAGVEIGVYAGKNSTKEQVRELIALLLQKAADRELVHGLALEQDRLERAGLTFEVTPDTSADAHGGWWISIYDARALQSARATGPELKAISTPATAKAPDTRGPVGLGQERRKAAKKVPTTKPPERIYIPDYSQENGVYVSPER